MSIGLAPPRDDDVRRHTSHRESKPYIPAAILKPIARALACDLVVSLWPGAHSPNTYRIFTLFGQSHCTGRVVYCPEVCGERPSPHAPWLRFQ
jgi:hypothetical protein